MGLSISKFITSNFAKKTVTKFFEQTSNIVEAAKPIKLVKGKLTYLFNPNTNHTIIRNLDQRMSIVMNGQYPKSSFLQFGLKPHSFKDFGDAKIERIINAKSRTITYRKKGADFWPTLTQANLECQQLRF